MSYRRTPFGLSQKDKNQASGKHNRQLNREERDVLEKWFEKYFQLPAKHSRAYINSDQGGST